MGAVVPDWRPETGVMGTITQGFSCVLGNGESGGGLARGQGHGQGCVLEVTLLVVRQKVWPTFLM